MISIVHYRKKCIGCNACVEADRIRWRMSRKDGKSTLIGGKEKRGIYIAEVQDDESGSAMKAVKICPVKIIKAVKRS